MKGYYMEPANNDLNLDMLNKKLNHVFLKLKVGKMERVTTVAEDEIIRGRIKLRQVGKQIRGKASRFCSQMSNHALDVQQEKNTLTKELNVVVFISTVHSLSSSREGMITRLKFGTTKHTGAFSRYGFTHHKNLGGGGSATERHSNRLEET